MLQAFRRKEEKAGGGGGRKRILMTNIWTYEAAGIIHHT